MPTAVSLFSGCGGSDYGLHAAGFNVLMANDILKHASIVYKANLPETDFHLGDVTKIKKFPNADLLVGCYPCQGFSQGGLRDPSKKINYLYQEFDRALRAIKPKAFVVENVSGMTRTDFSHLLRNQLVRYRFAGYRVDWKVLNALDYGLAQERKRIFLVGIRSDLGFRYTFPEPTHGEKRNSPHLNQKAIIGDMPEWPEGEFYDKGFHWYYMSRNRYRNWNEPSKTIVSNERHIPLHPISPPLIKLGHNEWDFAEKQPARRLSFREAALLQGFPKSFVFPEELSLKKKYEIIGNAVPPPLFKAVVKALPAIWV
jgi:DNA (cytosine-5)-methyltransferase 1